MLLLAVLELQVLCKHNATIFLLVLNSPQCQRNGKKPKSYITDSAGLSTKKKTEHEGLVSKGCQEKALSLRKERDSTAYCEHGGGRLMMWVYFGAT